MAASKRKVVNPKKTTVRAEPLTVSVSLGATIPVGDFQNIRPAVEIRNIRLDLPIEPQVKNAIEAAKVAWIAIDNEMEIQITEMVAGAVGQPTIRDTLEGITAWIDGVAKKSFKNISKEVKRHKDQLAKLEDPKDQ